VLVAAVVGSTPSPETTEYLANALLHALLSVDPMRPIIALVLSPMLVGGVEPMYKRAKLAADQAAADLLEAQLIVLEALTDDLYLSFEEVLTLARARRRSWRKRCSSQIPKFRMATLNYWKL
jgi:hypothetical protein